MGKNLLRKIFAFVVMVVGAVTVFSACSKDPYKKMRLSLDKNEVNITYDADDIENNNFTISATVSGVGKSVSKDVTFVVGDNSIVSPIGTDYVHMSGDKTTATFTATQNGGTTYIDVLTLEGNLKQRVVVNVIIPIESMSFEMETLPIERGVKTDITSKFDGVSTQIYNRLSYVPQNTTQKDVILTVTDTAGGVFGDNEVTIDGNYITVNSDSLTSFNLTATSRYNSEIVNSITCTVLDTINTDNVGLKQNVEGSDPLDLQLTYENGEKVYVLNLANASSNANDDKQKNIYVDFVDLDITTALDKYVVTCVKPDGIPFGIAPDDQNGFVVYGGSGKSTGLVNFALNYKGYENLFAPKYVTLRVNVSTFPDKISFTDGQNEIDSVKVYQNYGGLVAGASAVLNIFSGETSLSTQTAYLSAVASGYGAVSGIKLWYYSYGVKYEIGAKTPIRHNEKIYISFDAGALADFTNTIELVAKSTVNDVEGRVVLNLVKGNVAPVFANGSLVKMKETVSAEETSTFLLGTVELEDMPYLTLGNNEVALSECSVKLQNNSVVTCVYDEEQNGFVLTAGKLPTGVTDTTVYGTITTPNGMSADFSVLVYANINSDTLAFRIGNKNYTFVDDESIVDANKINMQTSSWFDIKLVKLLDFLTDDSGEPTTDYDPEGRYEVIETIPKNIIFENVTYGDGDAVVSVDFSNKLHISSTRNTGTRTIQYELSMSSYDPSISTEKDYMFIAFEITVEARLNGFSLSSLTLDGGKTFSIITDQSIEHKDAKDQKTASLEATARPNNTVLDYDNLAFEVRYENYTEKNDEPKETTLDGKNGRKYEFTLKSGEDKTISKFSIFAWIENNVITMTFACDDMTGIDTANIRITLVYTQTFVDIDGNENSYSDRSTVFEGMIRKAVKVTNIAFDRQEVLFNVNQFGIDANGNVQNTDRAKTSVNYILTPATNLTLNGFYLFYKIGDNSIVQANIQNDVYNINGILKVVVGDGYVGLEITKYDDDISSIQIYLVPIDMSDADGKVKPDTVETSLIPAKLKVSFRNGTSDNPYKIQDAYDLQFVNNQLDAYYELTNDILISDSSEWTPIGKNAENQFTGNIKGNGYRISGLVLNGKVNLDNASATGETKQVVVDASQTVTVKGYASYFGLFGYIGVGAEISDITFENFQVYVEYNGESLGVEIDEQNNQISYRGQNVYIDVYVGGFAGLNLGTLTNVTVVDDTDRGYVSIKGNILNTLRMTDDNVVKYKGVAYQPRNIYLIHSNNVFAGGMVGANLGHIDGGKTNVSLFVRDKQEHPTLRGISTAYVGGGTGANMSVNLKSGDIIYDSGILKNVSVYSLINATLVDPVFKGMIRNENSVLGGVVGINLSSQNKFGYVHDIECQTIIIGQDNIGGVIGHNYGVLDNVDVVPHIYGCDYIGGAVGININSANGLIIGSKYSAVSRYFTLADAKQGLIASNSGECKGLVYHTKVKFVDTVDEISLYNASIIGRNNIGGLVGFTIDSNAENVNLQSETNLKKASQYSFGLDDNNTYATIAYSSVKSYFTRESTNVNSDADEVKYLTQLYMEFDHKDSAGNVVFDKNIGANAGSKYYGDIIVLAPTNTDVKNTYIGGLVGYSDGGVSTNGTEIENGSGSNLIHVYFDAIISNTYNTNSDNDTAVIGGLIGKANGILFVYNANVLGSVQNSKCVGGFVGDASEIFDRLGYENKTPYRKGDGNFFEKNITNNYSGKFNINNSYTVLKAGDEYAQNFACIGERIEHRSDSGNLDSGQVNSITYSTAVWGYEGDDHNYYHPERGVNYVTIKEYKENTIKETKSTRKVEYRKILKYEGPTEKFAIQSGYKAKVSAPTYAENKESVEGYTDAGIFRNNGNKTYYTLSQSTDEEGNTTNTWASTTFPEYVKLYYTTGATIPQYYKETDLTFSSKDGTYLYDENGVAKYRKTDYFIETSSESHNYYEDEVEDSEIESTSPINVTRYECTPAYVEVEPNYIATTLTIYNNGVENSGNDFYWYSNYIYTASTNTTEIGSVEYTIYEKGDFKTKDTLAQASTYEEYVVGDTVYSNIEVDRAGRENRRITFKYKDTTKSDCVVDFDDKNMYHLMLDYVVNGQALNSITTGTQGQGQIVFSYNRLTASNSFYVGFETYLYDKDGKVLKENEENKKVTFTESDAKNTTLTTNEETDRTHYSYYPTDWHYTNINYSDLVFEAYSSESNLVGYHVQYEDSSDKECEITEYTEGQPLIEGVGFVNPNLYISGYDLSTYKYSMYEGGGDSGIVDGSSTKDKYTYHNADVNSGFPLAFGKYQEEDDEKTLKLVVDIAPESLSATDKENNYKVDNVVKNADGGLTIDTASRPIGVVLDYDSNSETIYDLIGGDNNIVDIKLLPTFVGYGNLNIVSSNSAVVEVVKGDDCYRLKTKGVGSAVLNVSSILNNSLSCNIVVMVKEKVTSLKYSYSTPNGVKSLTNDSTISILKDNTSIFSITAKNDDNDIVLANFGVEYKITSGSAIINGVKYNENDIVVTYGVSQSFKVSEEYNISAKPFYLYEVRVGDKTYAYRKYVDALTGMSKVNTDCITYTVSPNSFAYNITAPGDIQSGIANQTSFELNIQSNDEILVPFDICFGEQDGDGNDKYYTVKTTLESGSYVSVYNIGEGADTVKVGGLNVTLVSTTYDAVRRRHTVRFVADVNYTDYNQFTNTTDFAISCKLAKENVADNVEKSDEFTFTLLPFQVENVRLSHYTKFWYDESASDDKYETEYKSYKYASNKIIPGYNSLLQADITPSYGKFDYVIAEIVGADGSIIRQVVESQKSRDNAQGVSAYYDFPYFEQVNNSSNVIKVSNKYSSFNDDLSNEGTNYDPSIALGSDKQKYFKWDESGTLLFALNLDSKYANSTVTVNIKGYSVEKSGDTLQFEQSITLDVVELPRITITWDRSDNEFSTGTSTNATLNLGGTLGINVDTNASVEFSTSFGRVEYKNGKYVYSLGENLGGNIENILNKDIPIVCTATKSVDGAKYSTYSTIYVRPVYFLVSGVTFVDSSNTPITSNSMKVYYNETKDIKVQVDAVYDESLLEKYNKSDEVLDQIKALADIIWGSATKNGDIYSTRYFGRNEIPSDRDTTWFTTGDYLPRGYAISAVTHDDNFVNFQIHIASSSVKDSIVAFVVYDYSVSGVTLLENNDPSVASLYAGSVQKTLTFDVHASSQVEKPLPVKSVDDFKNMVAGENYILLNDLVLSKWVPIEALFRSFDGNGYTITITSFGDVTGLTEIGLFSTIGTDNDELGYYTTIQNLYIDICPVIEGESGTLSIDQTAMLEVNIGTTEDVHVGVLAGVNYGVITNVNVTNNASDIRNNRKDTLKNVKYSPLIGESFAKYFDSSKKYTDSLESGDTINIDTDNMVDTFSIITSDTKETLGLYVGGLVGLNSAVGYITNSSVENVNIKGIDYVAGFVSQNMGYISSSYFKGGSVISNDKQTKANSATAGFVAKNENGKIQFSYVLGAETKDVYGKNTIEGTLNNMSTYIDGDMLVINSNSPEYSASDKRTGKIKISLTDYAGYQMYKGGKNPNFANLRALGSAVYTNNYASGFVGENSAYISNCYANILVSGTYGAGFAYQNNGEIDSSYAMSSIRNNNENYYPFSQSKTDVEKTFYLYINANDGITEDGIKDSFSKANDDVATSLSALDFKDYNTFTSWGFNSDYAKNEKLDDGVWFIPTTNVNGIKKYLRESSYVENRPELVSANIFTMSLRYYVTETDGNFSYVNVDTWTIGDRNIGISQGSLNNPLLILTASDFNTNLSPAKDSKGKNAPNSSIVRMVHDIAFNEVQTATTFTTDFVGNFEGNGLSIDKLRIIADASSTTNDVTYLGLFRSIQSGTVRNLNINIDEITGSNINFVGVLAGVIDGGKVYNIKTSSTYENVRVEGLNAVGGLAGMIVGDADIVNITNNISVKANAINQLNIFDPKKPNIQNTKFKMFVPNDATKNPFSGKDVTAIYSTGTTEQVIADTIKNISYAGGIAGIIDVNENSKDDSLKKLDYTDRIRQCYVNESITLSGDVVGGLAGYVGSDSHLSNSEFVVCENTTLNALRVGGVIIGHNEGVLNRVVVRYNNQKQVDSNFYIAENNTQNNSAYYNALDNARSDSAYTLNIRSDVFSGNAHYIGGIIGANIGGTIKNSYSRLNVVNINSAYAGGIIGLNVGGELNSVYTTGSVKGYFATGGIIGIQPAVRFYGDKLYLDDQSSALNSNSYDRRYIDNIHDVLWTLCSNMGSVSSVEIKPVVRPSVISIRKIPYDPTQIQTKYSNIVGANIWRRSDTSVYRSEYNSTQRDAWIGVFVGYMSDITNTTIFEKGYKYLSPIQENSVSSRLSIENTFFKQTYVYNPNSNDLIGEIGNISSANISIEDTDDTIKVKVNTDSMYSGIYTLDKINYRFSRIQKYGSLRSLNEIICRAYSITDANNLWEHIYVSGREEQGDKVKQLSIYFGYDTFNWNGTQIDNENNTIINEVSGVRDVFPSIVNNLKPKVIYVSSEDDLRKMQIYLDSTFILQKDIELEIKWEPVGTEEKPFTGELKSADSAYIHTISGLSMEETQNDYFGFVRVSAGASFNNFNLKCGSIANNLQDPASTTASTTGKSLSSIAGGILIGLADKDENDNSTSIENVKIITTNIVSIQNTQYVGGFVGYGKNLALSGDVSLTKEEEAKASTNSKFYASMYADSKNNVSFGFGGIVGRFDDLTQSRTGTVSVNEIDFYVNYLNNEDKKVSLDQMTNREFKEDTNNVYVGGVFGVNETTPTWNIKTSGVNLTTYIPTYSTTSYDSYIGGAIGKTNAKYEYTSTAEDKPFDIDTNLTVDVSDVKGVTATYVGGVFGYVNDAYVSGVNNDHSNTIKVTVDESSNNSTMYIGGVVGQSSSVTFENVKSNTTSNITTNKQHSNIYSGGFVGYAQNSTIRNVEISGGKIESEILVSKIDLITLKDSNNGNKKIALGGLAGYMENTTISVSNVLGNIRHEKDEEGSTYSYDSDSTYEVYIGGAVGYSKPTKNNSLNKVSADVDIIDNRFTLENGTFNYGGLVGFADTYTIQNSYAVGKIYSAQHITYLGNTTPDKSNDTYLGGLVGNGKSVTFANCYSATQFVLPNGDDALLEYKQSFWENTNKGGIIGNTSGECTSTNVYYVKDFVPFSNGLCGTGVNAEDLSSTIHKNGDWNSEGNGQFYPIQVSNIVTNVKGGGQNPIVVTNGTGYTTITDTKGVTTNHIKSAQTVYVKGDNTGSDYNIELDDRMSTLVIIGNNKLTQNEAITNSGTIYGGKIKDETITNNGNIIGVLNGDHDGELKYDEEGRIKNRYKVNNTNGFIYASGVFDMTNENTNTSLVINSIYTCDNTLIYCKNNLFIDGDKKVYTGSSKSTTKSGLYAKNVEFFDASDASLDLDIDKYWTRVRVVNDDMLVPKWMYKNHYYDDDYNSTYGWYASAEQSGVAISGNTYTVKNAEGLAYIAKQVNTGEITTDITIELSADIDLIEKVWTPIGTMEKPFKGTFKGNGHTISNMSVVGNTYNGLFGVTNGATIQDLLIKDAQVASSGIKDYTAILVGYAKATLKVEQVGIEDAHICAGNNNNNVAGMVGYLDGCTLTVNNAYVVIAVNDSRSLSLKEFSFVVNASSNSNIEFRNVYGANIGLKETTSTLYEIVPQVETLGSQTHPYYMANNIVVDENKVNNSYVVRADSGSYTNPLTNTITALKTLNELRSETTDLFKNAKNESLWGTTWARQYDSKTTKNYGLPILSFSQEYWIDEGEKTTSAVKESDNTYTIATASQLAWVAYQVNENNNSFDGKTIVVVNNIDLAGKVWTPIGITDKPFKGSFVLAEGKTISNMTCYGAYSTTREDLSTTTSYSKGYDTTYGGLFGLVQDSPSMVIKGSITNFVVSKVTYGAPFIAEYKVSSLTTAPTISVADIGTSEDDSLKDTVNASSCAGGVVGKITGTNSAKVNLTGAVNKASVSAEFAGGIVGMAEYITLYSSIVQNTSITGTSYTGGIAGKVRYSTLFNCQTTSVSLNSTHTFNVIGGIVGVADYSNLSALKVTTLTATNIKASSFGGIVGAVYDSTIQNVTIGKIISKSESESANNITLSDVFCYGGVVGEMETTNLSEVAVLGKQPNIIISSKDYYGLVVGYIHQYSTYYKDNKSYIVDNIYLNIESNEPVSEGDRDSLYCDFIFGGINSSTKDIFTYTMFSMKNVYVDGKNCSILGDCAKSSAWSDKPISVDCTDSDNITHTKYYHELKANTSESLCSNYRVANANKLTDLVNNIETITIGDKEYVVITPYSLDSVSVKDSDGMQYLADWWKYRHKLSDNDTTINIVDNIEPYQATSSIGSEKFPFVGALCGVDDKNNPVQRMIVFDGIVKNSGIIGYATKIDASDITLEQRGYMSQGFGVSGSDYVGALVGRINGSTNMSIKNITSYVMVKGGTECSYIGGLIGAVDLSYSCELTMTNCQVLTYTQDDGYTIDGKEKSSIIGGSYVGGLIGAVNPNQSNAGKVTITGESESSPATIQRDIEANGNNVGSVVGYGKNVTITYYNIKPLKYAKDDMVKADWLIMVRSKKSSAMNMGGVAGKLENSEISNVTLDGISVSTSKENKKTGDTSVANNMTNVGGAVGWPISSTISNITIKNEQENTNFVISGQYRVGGLVGYSQYNFNNAGTPISKIYITSNTISGVTIEGYGKIGGLVGELESSKQSDDSYDKLIKVDLKDINKNIVDDCTVKMLENSDDDYVGGLIGKLTANSYWTGRTVCAGCGVPVTIVGKNNYIKSCTVDCIIQASKTAGGTLKPTFNMTSSGDSINKVQNSTIVYTKKFDKDEGWFGRYTNDGSTDTNDIGDLSSDNRWDKNYVTSTTISFSDARNMAMGRYAQQYDKREAGKWAYASWWDPTYKGYRRNFYFSNVGTYNTWFGPTSGTNETDTTKIEAITTSTLKPKNCVYISTFGNTDNINYYENESRTVPDLSNNTNIGNFFKSARGYNQYLSVPYVGTLYGTNNIIDNNSITTEVKIKSQEYSNASRVLMDRFTHWAYIAMQDSEGLNHYGLLIIEWSYYIDNDQRIPQSYDFISDVQKDFVSKENQRIDVKFRYDVKVDIVPNALKEAYSTFNVNFENADQVSKPLRSLKDLLGGRVTQKTSGSATNYTVTKGLINEFIIAVYKKDTENTSLYCGNSWMSVDEYGKSEYDISLNYFGTDETYIYGSQFENSTKYYRYANDNNVSLIEPTTWYCDKYFGGERRITKQKSAMNQK